MTGEARRIKADLVLDGRWELGEGPIWDTRNQELVWVDIPGDQVLRWRPGDDRARALPTPLDIGSVAVRADGGYVAALADGFWVVDADSERWQPFARVEADRPDLRFNDGKCDPAWPVPGGLDGLRQAPRGRWLLPARPRRDGGAAADDITISNGLTWTPGWPDDVLHRYADAEDRRLRLRPRDGSDERAAHPHRARARRAG